MVTWSDTEWDTAASEDGVVHESTANTDHDDASVVKQGYPYDSFDVIDPNPVAAWPLHEDSGTTANDLSGNGNDGTYNGPTLGQTGLLGTTAPSFDGTDDRVETPINVTDYSAFSIGIWVYFSGLSGLSTIFSAYDGTNEVVLRYDTSGWDFFTFDGNNAVGINNDGTSLSTGQWYFIVASFGGTNGYTLYQDGSQQSSAASTTLHTVNQTQWIGVEAGLGSRPLAGRVAHGCVWTTELSATEVQTLYDVVNERGRLITGAQTL